MVFLDSLFRFLMANYRWMLLLAANGAGLLAMILSRCDCGGPETAPIVSRFAVGGIVLGAAFALAALPFAMAWNWAAPRWLHRGSAPVWKCLLAAALTGSACNAYMDSTW